MPWVSRICWIDGSVPHDLTEKQKSKQVHVADSLLQRNNQVPLLGRLITGDEKWVVYNNVRQGRSWVGRGQAAQSVPKAKPFQKKLMLSVWWEDYQGIVYYEFLPRGQTITWALYCQQLERLAAAIKEKRPALANRKGVVGLPA